MELGKPDFSGWATKHDVLCSDGRTIKPSAFAHQNKMKVPLVYAHDHKDNESVLGFAILEHKDEGIRIEGYLNETPKGKNAKLQIQHGDIDALSIWANKLQQDRERNVLRGDIKEVSLVMHGANPGALIDNVYLRHDGEIDLVEDEAIIYSGESIDMLSHEEKEEVDTVGDQDQQQEEQLQHGDRTVKDVFDAMSEEQKNVVYFMIGEAVNGQSDSLAQSDLTEFGGAILQHIQEGFDNMGNVFEEQGNVATASTRKKLSHDQLESIVSDFKKNGSLKDAFLAHAGDFIEHAGVAGEDYGIEDIEFLFPDARTLENSPQFLSRRMDWVKDVLDTTKHSPFGRIKSVVADITAEEARAKGYVKGNLKRDEVIKLLKRITTPKTIYKKQKLDRDDIIDITDIDVVVWIKAEMRIMLDEEIARAILVGDGREPDDPDKIDEDHVRPIAYDADMYAIKVTLDGTPTPEEIEDAIVEAQNDYKGSGNPTLYTTAAKRTQLLLQRDTTGHRIYKTEDELAAALLVKKIVVVEAVENNADVWGIIVNLIDYTVGADKGGEINFFDDFDIDYNQEKYLLETRISGALTKPAAAIVILQNPGTVLTPVAPTFVSGTGVVTIPTAVTGITWKNKDTDATLSSGAQSAIASGATIAVVAVPSAGYSFPHGFDADWEFTRS